MEPGVFRSSTGMAWNAAGATTPVSCCWCSSTKVCSTTVARRWLPRSKRWPGGCVPLLVNEDVHGAWSRTLGMAERRGDGGWVLLSPKGAVTWRHEGRLSGEVLTGALDSHLHRSPDASPSPTRGSLEVGAKLSGAALFPGSSTSSSPSRSPWAAGLARRRPSSRSSRRAANRRRRTCDSSTPTTGRRATLSGWWWSSSTAPARARPRHRRRAGHRLHHDPRSRRRDRRSAGRRHLADHRHR